MPHPPPRQPEASVVILALTGTLALSPGFASDLPGPGGRPVPVVAVANQQPVPAPPLEVEPAEIDLGSLQQGDTTRFSFTLHNRGDQPLRPRLNPDCSCVQVKHAPEELAAGERATVELEMATGRLAPAPQHGKILLVSAEGYPAPLPPVKITFALEPVFETGPLPLLISALPGQQPRRVLTLRPARTPAPEVLAASAHHGKISVALLPGDPPRLEIEAPVQDTVTTFPECIDLRLRTPAGEERTIEIPLQVEFRDRITHSPGLLTFRRAQTEPLGRTPPEPVRQTLTVWTEEDGHHFRITSVELEEVPDGLVATEVRTLEEGRRYEVEVTLTRNHVERSLRGRLVVTTDDPLSPPRRILLVGQFP